MKVIGWDGGTRYLVAMPGPEDPSTPGRVVDVKDGSRGPLLKIGSILAMGEPDEFNPERRGPQEARALALARANG